MKPKRFLPFLLLGLLLLANPMFAQTDEVTCPCADAIQELVDAYENNPVFHLLIDTAFENMQPLPEGFRQGGNPWIGKDFSDLVALWEEWCTFLPTSIGSSDNGLLFIEQMDLFAYENPFARAAFQTSPGIEIFEHFVQQRGQYMDSPESTRTIPTWIGNPRTEIEEYVLPNPDAPDGGFSSFNEFFIRSFKDQQASRPQTMPDRDYVITAPTDAIMNSIPVPIVDNQARIQTKGTQRLSIEQLLQGSAYWDRFIGGTALSCILMPNTYHHYHSPVDGAVIETRLLEGGLLGMMDFPEFAGPHGNVGSPGSDFSAFENYQRGYFIIDTGKYGLVAVVPVGLSTIGSVVFEEKFLSTSEPVPVRKGDELGHFRYGGSLVILVFEPGKYVSGAIKVRLGNQIGIFDTDGNE